MNSKLIYDLKIWNLISKIRYISKYLVCFLLFSSFSYVVCGQLAGSLDSTFNSIGKQTLSIDGIEERAYEVALQSDGKIVVAGSSHNGSHKVFAVVRFESDGVLDTSFGMNGIVTTALSGGNDTPSDIAIQGDGKILVVGRVTTGTDVDFGTVRYNSNGTLDTSFSMGGIKIDSISSSNDFPYSILLTNSDKILIAGGSGSGIRKFTIVGYDEFGETDSTFGINGISLLNIGGSSTIKDMKYQSDGKIVASGITNSIWPDFAVSRFFPNGAIDSTFGTNGIVIYDVLATLASVNSLVVQQDGKILVGGFADFTGGGSNHDFIMVRFNSDGTLDNSFDLDGIVTTAFSSSNDDISKIIQQTDGKIIAVGVSFQTLTAGKFTVARYNLNGTLDSSFGTGGVVTTNFSNNFGGAWSALIQPDDRIVVVGQSEINGSWNMAMARYNSGLHVGIVEPNNNDIKIIAYPNPIQEMVNITYTLAEDCAVELLLYGINGKYIQPIRSLETRQKGDNKESVHINDNIPSGFYILKLSACNSEYYIKLIKN